MGAEEAGRGSQGMVALLRCFSAPRSPCPLQHPCGAQPMAGDSLCRSILGTSWALETPCTPPLPVSVSGLTSPH